MGSAWSQQEGADDDEVSGSEEDADSELSEASVQATPICGWFLSPPTAKTRATSTGGFGKFITSTDIKTGRACVNASKRENHRIAAPDNTDRDIDDYIDIDRTKVLGEGGFAKVLLGRIRRTGQPVAVKTINKAKVPDKNRLKVELDIMLALDHPNIVKLWETFECDDKIHLVMQVCSGGEMFDVILKDGHVSERASAHIAKQMFKGVNYMHVNGVCHRDLKPENYLFQERGVDLSRNNLKLIDFGIAVRFREGQRMYTRTGTPNYVAPEILSHWFGYGPQCDLWSCGVILFVLLSGQLPFKGNNDMERLALIRRGEWSFKAKAWNSVSQNPKKIIKGLLQLNPDHRLTAEEVLDHDWLVEMDAVPNVVRQDHVQALRDFQGQSRFQKAARQMVARQLKEDQIAELSEVFSQLDANGDGTLSYDELFDGFEAIGGVQSQELKDLVRSADANGEGTLDYTEFLAATLHQRQFNEESACLAAFHVFDADDDGYITLDELEKAFEFPELANLRGDAPLHEIFAEADLNGDNKIDFAEFRALVTR